MISRRHFLCSAAMLAAAPLLRATTPARVAVVGGGWGGLSAAAWLRRLAPGLDVVLIERSPFFFSAPLSNHWLSGRIDPAFLRHDYERIAVRHGYRLLRAEVRGIDRDHRRIDTDAGPQVYDGLIVAAGIRDHYAAWFGGDAKTAAEASHAFPSGFQAQEIVRVKQKIEAFAGGILLMTVPPLPYRCPPAPYERACVIAEQFRRRGVKGRIVLVDPNSGMAPFTRAFRDRYRDQITYLPQSRIRRVDHVARLLSTDFDEIRFDDAVLAPQQQAADLLWQAGLVDTASGWVAAHPTRLTVAGDERVRVIGDAMGPVSPVFGHYPKTGHLASSLGRIAAEQVAASLAGKEIQLRLPDSICHVATSFEPLELLRIETRYRVRGDGVLLQTVEQKPDPNPRDEDIAWAKERFDEIL